MSDECEKCDATINAFGTKIRLGVGSNACVCSNECLFALAGHGLDDRPGPWSLEQRAVHVEANEANPPGTIMGTNDWDAKHRAAYMGPVRDEKAWEATVDRVQKAHPAPFKVGDRCDVCGQPGPCDVRQILEAALNGERDLRADIASEIRLKASLCLEGNDRLDELADEIQGNCL